ncbi:hypothetical protein B0H19DRAFT_1272295 [Mycena capillaripes]|nr:hypothetical protein B0H19DRAFT_1272295 [Mycena capillaripes]
MALESFLLHISLRPSLWNTGHIHLAHVVCTVLRLLPLDLLAASSAAASQPALYPYRRLKITSATSSRVASPLLYTLAMYLTVDCVKRSYLSAPPIRRLPSPSSVPLPLRHLRTTGDPDLHSSFQAASLTLAPVLPARGPHSPLRVTNLCFFIR